MKLEVKARLFSSPPQEKISVLFKFTDILCFPSFLYPLLQVSTIATSDDYARNLADSFERAARLQGIRIHASSRFSSRASPEVLDSKMQLVRLVL